MTTWAVEVRWETQHSTRNKWFTVAGGDELDAMSNAFRDFQHSEDWGFSSGPLRPDTVTLIAHQCEAEERE